MIFYEFLNNRGLQNAVAAEIIVFIC